MLHVSYCYDLLAVVVVDVVGSVVADVVSVVDVAVGVVTSWIGGNGLYTYTGTSFGGVMRSCTSGYKKRFHGYVINQTPVIAQ